MARLPAGNFSSGPTGRARPGALPGQPRPKGRSSVSTEQRETLDAILRQSAFPADIDVSEQYGRLLRELTSAQPLAAEVTVTAAALGGVPAAEITIDGIERRHVGPVFPRRRVRTGGRLFRRRAGRASGRPADPRHGHLGRLPARPRAPVPGSGRRRPCRLPSPPAGRHRPVGHRLRRRVRRRRPRHRHPGQCPRSRAAPARRGLRHVTVCRPHPGRDDHGHQDHRGVPRERGQGWRELRGRSAGPRASPRPQKRAGSSSTR